MTGRRIVLAYTGGPESSAVPARLKEQAAVTAVVEESRKGVHGTARVRLFMGGASVVGRRSAASLYNPAPPGAGEAADAGGYVRTNGRRLSLNKTLRKGL